VLAVLLPAWRLALRARALLRGREIIFGSRGSAADQYVYMNTKYGCIYVMCCQDMNTGTCSGEIPGESSAESQQN
jgi:hypothetical protein